MPVCTDPSTQYDVRLVPDGQGGLAAVWADNRHFGGDAFEAYFQHLDASGNPLLQLNGVPILDPPGFRQGVGDLDGVPDGQGGSVWHTAWATNPNMYYIVRVNGAGHTVWYFNNFTLYWHEPGDLLRHPDGTFWASVYEQRVAAPDDYVYHFDIGGNQLLGPLGRRLGRVLTLSTEGAIAGRYTLYSSRTRLDSERVDSAGAVSSISPFAMSNQADAFYITTAASDGADGVVYPMRDARDPLDRENISAQRVNADGTLGTPNKIRPQPDKNVESLPGETPLFMLDKAGLVKIEVFDVLGRQVLTRGEGFQPPGPYRVDMAGWDLPSGVYMVKLISAEKEQVKKIVIAR